MCATLIAMSNPDQSGKRRPSLLISSEEEFQALMEEIDGEMIAERVGIPARPIVAGLKISGRYDIVLELVPSDTPIVPGLFTPHQISIRILDWMKKRYGNRLNLTFTIGRVVIPLRGSLYTIKCPVVYGTVEFVCEPHTFGHPREKIAILSPPKCNIVDLIDDFTADLASTLTAVEIAQISTVHATAMAAFMTLHAVSDAQYVKEALGDLAAAVNHLMEHNPQLGLSKWASLQAIEKMMKAYIAAKGQAVQRTHSLQELSKQATNLGFPPPPQQYLKNVQCSASVRYGEEPVSLDEAVMAQIISLEICEVAGQSTGKALGRYMPKNSQPLIDGIPAREFLEKLAR